MFGPRIQLFRVAGIGIKADASWFVVAALLTWLLAEGFFPLDHPGVGRVGAWAMGLAGALGLFGSIVLHELGHALAARRLSLSIRSITLFIFGGVAEMEDEPPNAGAEFLVAVAGPIVSVGLAGAAAAGGVALGAADAPRLSALLLYLAWANALLVLFNLIPAFPLDGGRVLRSILWAATGSLEAATRFSTLLGRVFGWALIAAGVAITIWTGSLLAGLWTALVGWFLRRAAAGAWRHLLLRRALEGHTVEAFMRRDPVSIPPSLSIAELVQDYVYRYKHAMFPVLQGERLIGCVCAGRVREVPREEWCRRSVTSLLEAPSDDNTISPRAEAIQALARMRRGSRLMVVDGDRLVGIVSLRDLLRFLALRAEVGEAA
jgi:Zn-dependent protease/CBS domain-containing protein